MWKFIRIACVFLEHRLIIICSAYFRLIPGGEHHQNIPWARRSFSHFSTGSESFEDLVGCRPRELEIYRTFRFNNRFKFPLYIEVYMLRTLTNSFGGSIRILRYHAILTDWFSILSTINPFASFLLTPSSAELNPKAHSKFQWLTFCWNFYRWWQKTRPAWQQPDDRAVVSDS